MSRIVSEPAAAGASPVASARKLPAACLVLLGAMLATVSVGRATEPEAALPVVLQRIYDAGVPTSVAELQLMETHQQELIQRLTPLTVGLELGPTQGSGVLISEDGLILTAAHVAGEPDRTVTVWMSDGQRYRGKTLGLNNDMDAGLIQLMPPAVKPGEVAKVWPHAAMGDTSRVRPGSWCLALGHPGGFQPDRPPVARFGRVLNVSNRVIETECILIGGDSGGPLFDMEGRVIGIHSRIGSQLSKNLHVPVHAYRDSWNRLLRGDAWGSLLSLVGRPAIGVTGDRDSDSPRIAKVLPASPAESAGLQPGDLVVRFGEDPVTSFGDLKTLVGRRNPGDEVVIAVQRGGETLEIALVVGSLSSE